jgi:hypothetical protein
VLQSSYPGLAGLAFVVIGVGAVALGRDPNGIANLLFALGRKVEGRLWPAVADRMPSLPSLPRPGLRREDEPVGKHRHVDQPAWRIDLAADDTQVVPMEGVAGHGASRG